MAIPQHHLAHLSNFVDNAEKVERLLQIHGELTGTGRGRRTGVEVLNKSGIVLLVACWEAFVEDLLLGAVLEMTSAISDPTELPRRVRAGIGTSLQDQKDPRTVWRLAGDGWRTVVEERAKSLASKLNTPRSEQIDRLYEKALGLEDMSAAWTWHRTHADRARAKLNDLIDLRGSIAHRVATSASVRKTDVTSNVDFIYRLAVKSHNRVGDFLISSVVGATWSQANYSRKWRTKS